MKLEFSWQFFVKYWNIKFNEIRSVEAKLFHSDERRDREMPKLIVTFRNIANAPKNSSEQQ
jgi:hypothetical protein